MKPAGFWRRFLAFWIDGAVFLIPGLMMNLVLRLALAGAVGKLATLLALFPVAQAYPILGHYWFGQTIGKYVLRIRVENLDGGRLGLLQSVLRSSVSVGLSFLMLAIQIVFTVSAGAEGPSSPGGLAVALARQPSLPLFVVGWFLLSFLWEVVNLVSILVDSRKRAVHDLLAGTVVVVVDANAEAAAPSSPAVS